MRARTMQTAPGAGSRPPERPSYSVGSTHRGPTDRKRRPDDEMSEDTRALRQTTESLPEQAAADPDDTNRSRSRSPKRPQYSGGTLSFRSDRPSAPTRRRDKVRPPLRCRQTIPKTAATEIVRRHDTVVPNIGIPTFQAITSFDTPRFPPAVFESDRRLPQPRITHPDGPLPTDIKKIIRKTRRPSPPTAHPNMPWCSIKPASRQRNHRHGRSRSRPAGR